MAINIDVCFYCRKQRNGKKDPNFCGDYDDLVCNECRNREKNGERRTLGGEWVRD